MAETCQAVCAPTCAWVFDRIWVYHLVAGGSRVEWALHPKFVDPAPHTFQLQVGRTANPDADDWVDVGLPVTDGYYAIDDTQRVHGKTLWTHYRVKLTTSIGVYYSVPQPALGVLARREWLLARG